MDSLKLCKCGCNIAITKVDREFVDKSHYQVWRRANPVKTISKRRQWKVGKGRTSVFEPMEGIRIHKHNHGNKNTKVG